MTSVKSSPDFERPAVREIRLCARGRSYDITQGVFRKPLGLGHRITQPDELRAPSIVGTDSSGFSDGDRVA